MGERASALPEHIAQAIDKAVIDREALERGASFVGWKVPDDFDGMFRQILEDYARSISRLLYYDYFAQFAEKIGSHKVPLLFRVASTLRDREKLSFVRTVRDFGEYLGQHEALRSVACAVVEPLETAPSN